jgi:excisionase family DNA binding protein
MESMMNDVPVVLAFGIPEACNALSLGRTRIYALIAEGKLEARQCGGRTLIPGDSLRAFVANLPPAPIRRKDTA